MIESTFEMYFRGFLFLYGGLEYALTPRTISGRFLLPLLWQRRQPA